MSKAIGIDLAGLEKNPTGFAVISAKNINCEIVFRDEDILKKITNENPRIVAIDAPLSMPKLGEIIREVDKKLISTGYRVLPPLFGGMKSLTIRGIKLSKAINPEIEVIEVHPTTSRIRLGLSPDNIIKQLIRAGWRVTKPNPSKDEIDAILAAITASLYLKGSADVIGNKKESIIIPKIINE